MKEKVITVLKVKPGKHPEITKLGNDLDSLQKAISIGTDYQGLIELIAIDDENLILCNEEGKLIGLEPNRRFREDVICGAFYIVSQDSEGDLISISAAMQYRYTRMFWEPEVIDVEEVNMLTLYRLLPL